MVFCETSNFNKISAKLAFNDVMSFSSLVISMWSNVTGGSLRSSFATIIVRIRRLQDGDEDILKTLLTSVSTL